MKTSSMNATQLIQQTEALSAKETELLGNVLGREKKAKWLKKNIKLQCVGRSN